MQIAREVLAAVGGKENVTANDICMTRLRILTEDPSLVDTKQLSSTAGVLGIVRRGDNGIEVVFGPGKVDDVHEALADLTGLDSPDPDFDEDDSSDLDSIKALISRDSDDVAKQQEDDSADEGSDFTDVRKLVDLLDATDAEKNDAPSSWEDDESGARLLVINGPNINMLGIREPGIYGKENYAALLDLCKQSALEAGFSECRCEQSNHEGDLVDFIQSAYGNYDGIVINPGAYTHTSIAILDAAKAVRVPIVEVHISKVEEREDFRQVSYIRAACFETITGMGIDGYRKAIFDLAEKLDL